jgi:hypothetical protein
VVRSVFVGGAEDSKLSTCRYQTDHKPNFNCGYKKNRNSLILVGKEIKMLDPIANFNIYNS